MSDALKEFEASLISEDTIIGEEQQTETAAESPAETKEEETESPPHQGDEEVKEAEPSENTDDEDKVPFHKHPRFKELIEERNELRRQFEELRTTVDTVQQKIVPQNQEETIPQWFKGVYGDDVAMWKDYQSYEQEKLSKMKESIYQEQQDSQKKYEESVKRWEGYSKDQMQALEDEGKSFDKNELMKVVLDYQPTDKQGNFDFKKAYEILELKKMADHDPVKSAARKNLAASTTSNNKGEPKEKDYMTSDDFRGKNILDLIH